MVALKINGVSYQAKTSWDDVTMADFQRIYVQWKDELEKAPEDRDYFKLFCILNDFKFTDFIPTAAIQEAITVLVTWALVIPNFGPVPKTFSILGNTADIPTSFGMLSIGQNIVMKQLLDKATYNEELLTDAIAIGVQPLIDGKYISKRVAEFKEDILKRKVSECYELGFFFVARAVRAGLEHNTNWSPILNSHFMKPVKTFLLWLESIGWRASRIYRLSPGTLKGLGSTPMGMYSTGAASIRLSSLR